MKTPTITACLKTSCGWSQGVRSIMRKYNLAYEDVDIINSPFNLTEMIERSGQSFSPCVEINGHMLADVNGDEVEAYLLQAGLVQLTAVVVDAPTNRACDAHHHEQPRTEARGSGSFSNHQTDSSNTAKLLKRAESEDVPPARRMRLPLDEALYARRQRKCF